MASADRVVGFMLQRQRPLVRGSLGLGTAPVMGWFDVPYYGVHATREQLMRRVIWEEEQDPGWLDAPTSLIRRQWRAVNRQGYRTRPVRLSEGGDQLALVLG